MGEERTIMERLARAFPAEVVQQKPGRGGSKPLTYISHALVTERLNEVDPGWSWRVLTEHIWFDQGGQPHCAGVTVEMTVNGVTRVEAGGPQRQEAFTNEIKNAYSDALKRAAMRFGVALYIWDALVDAQDDEDAQGAPAAPRRMEPQERAHAAQGAPEEQHQRNTQPRPSSLPATRSKPPAQQPNGADETRRRFAEMGKQRGIPLSEEMTGDEMATVIDVALHGIGLDFRVQRGEDGSVTARALQNALVALPPKKKDGDEDFREVDRLVDAGLAAQAAARGTEAAE
jgi:hypothetical protein